MQGIFSTISRMWQLQVISLVNRLIYFMQSLPVIGSLIRDQTYAAFRTKRILGAIAVILRLGAGLFESILYFGVLLVWPILLWTEGPDTQRFTLLLHMYLCISGIMGGVTGAKVLESNKMKYTAVRLMRMNPNRFIRAVLLNRYTTFFLYQGIAFTLASVIFNFSIIHAWIAVGIMTFWRVLCEFFHLKLFQWNGIVLVRKTWLMSLTMLLTLTAAYLPLTQWSIPSFGSVVFDQQWLVILISLSGAVAGYMLLKHTDYASAVRAVTNYADPLLNTEIMIADLQQRMVQSKDNDLANLHAGEQSTLSNKGYEQMHVLFVNRHANLFRAPFRRRLIAIMVIGFILSFLALIFRDHISVEFIARFSPLLIVVMLHLTVGSQICRAFFYHCDRTLMRYPFYREHAQQHFLLRLRSLLKLNLKLGLCLAAVLSIPILILPDGATISALLPIWVITAALAAFFSVHHLLLYYVFQPYTLELETNSPLFSLANGFITLGFIVTMYLAPPLWALTVVLTVLTAAYPFSAILLVKKYAHNRFRLK
nr:hypothetical protein [Paenibacillus xylanexedens]